MAHAFDPGYVSEPFASLCRGYPGPDVYPAAEFRVEWGPIFHRGRLDGSARVLTIGQDPGAHEAVVRRILVGEAGQRVQGFLAKLGIESSYVMINTFLYSVYGQWGGERHKHDAQIIAYRNRWLDALLVDSGVEAVVAFGRLAGEAFALWQATPSGQGAHVAFVQVPHPTYPESSSGGKRDKQAEAMRAMLAQWNAASEQLRPASCTRTWTGRRCRTARRSLPRTSSRSRSPDLPAGLPPWMRSLRAWAARSGATPERKRATLVVTVPLHERPWSTQDG